MEKRTIRNIGFESEQYETLLMLARSEEISVSALVRDIVDYWLATSIASSRCDLCGRSAQRGEHFIPEPWTGDNRRYCPSCFTHQQVIVSVMGVDAYRKSLMEESTSNAF